jgi:hypothetical protein
VYYFSDSTALFRFIDSAWKYLHEIEDGVYLPSGIGILRPVLDQKLESRLLDMKIPRCMSTQHPDNAAVPFFASSSVLAGEKDRS